MRASGLIYVVRNNLWHVKAQRKCAKIYSRPTNRIEKFRGATAERRTYFVIE